MFNYYQKNLKEIRANISRKKGRLNKKNCPPIAKEQQISWRIINYSPISKKRKVGTWQAFTFFFKSYLFICVLGQVEVGPTTYQ
jgi:hypothetical protein